MSGLAVAKRYAKALFEVAREQDRLDQVEKDLQVVVETFAHSPELMAWLHHPATDPNQKKEVFSSIFKKLDPITQNTLFLLADRHREGMIRELAAEFKRLSLEAKGMAEAIVTTALPLTGKAKKQLIATFQSVVGNTLQIEEKVDPHILGGVMIQLGDRLYDGSLKTKLARFGGKLKETEIVI